MEDAGKHLEPIRGSIAAVAWMLLFNFVLSLFTMAYALTRGDTAYSIFASVAGGTFGGLIILILTAPARKIDGDGGGAAGRTRIGGWSKP